MLPCEEGVPVDRAPQWLLPLVVMVVVVGVVGEPPSEDPLVEPPSDDPLELPPSEEPLEPPPSVLVGVVATVVPWSPPPSDPDVAVVA